MLGLILGTLFGLIKEVYCRLSNTDGKRFKLEEIGSLLGMLTYTTLIQKVDAQGKVNRPTLMIEVF